VRNRANTPSRDEAAFINGGTAGIDNTKVTSERPLAVSKAKPVSISFFEENLKDIDDLITGEMISGKSRVNRSDVVRAAVEALKSLSKTEISRLIAEAKQRYILLSCYLVILLSCYLVILLSCSGW
jgi:chromosome partitioning protein